MQKIAKKLLQIQQELKAPKNQFNKFGNYKYRSCEDILEGLKPCLAKAKATVVLTDEIVVIEGRFYVKATATLIDTESDETMFTTAFAREEESKKGMDASQVTGSCSSYARKYALNALFNIDDTKDIDTRDNSDEGEKKKAETEKKPVNKAKTSVIEAKCKEAGLDTSKVLALYKHKSFNEFTEKQFEHFMENIDKLKASLGGN